MSRTSERTMRGTGTVGFDLVLYRAFSFPCSLAQRATVLRKTDRSFVWIAVNNNQNESNPFDLSYTCGAIETQGKFEHTFGYYVTRCRMPKQPRHWPAFWLQTPAMSKVGDGGRDGTEIDIVEIPWRDGQVTMNLSC